MSWKLWTKPAVLECLASSLEAFAMACRMVASEQRRDEAGTFDVQPEPPTPPQDN